MKSNGLLKWLMIPMAALLIFVGIRLFSGDRDREPAPSPTGSQLTTEEMKTLGVEGDSPRDTVATLVAQVKQLRNELQTALNDNKNQKTENDRLRQRENEVDRRIQTALDGERNRLQQDRAQVDSDQQQTHGLLQDLQRRLDDLGKKPGAADLPIGLGLEAGDEAPFDSDAVTWTEPDAGKPGKPEHSANDQQQALPSTSFAPAQKTLDSVEDAVDAGSKVMTSSTTKPVYTVPSNATLMGSIAMTALIGRVPVDGTVNDPYPFKVLIGRDNLTANGIELPDVAGAVVSGTASGDWTLSCVRGQIRSVTFVFQDGTIRTVPQSRGGDGNGSEQGNVTQGGLGWISDPYGIPCVSGERRSNAAQYLGSQALITAAGAGAASLIDSDAGSVSYISNGNGSLGTVGINGNEAMGRILAGGVQEMSQWVNKLYGQAFAAVYVPPGARVAVHIEQPLDIDYDAKGRRVDHRIGGDHAALLD
jgi:integrating conjugative element protein (TIGR03752 family)